MVTNRTYSELIERLKGAGLRPTRQRLALAKLLFGKGDRHTTAEKLHSEAREADVGVSLATVYNALNQFTEAGLLREVVVDASRSYFDTNVSDHHHFYIESSGTLMDVDSSALRLDSLPPPPDGREVERVDVIIRLK